jgi:ribulose-5-phosphate 4-epimerase/fuculose-1-phosphate aldolase
MKLHSMPALALLSVMFAVLIAQPLATAQSSQSATATPVDQAVIDDLVAANRILSDQQVLDAYGHVSVRHPSNPQHFLMGRNLAPALVTADDIVEYDLDGNAIGSKPGFTHFLERFIHGEIYRLRPDVNSVVHSHSTVVIPFANTQTQLKPMFHVSSFLAPNVPVFEIRKVTGSMSNMLIGDAKLGKALAETLGANSVVLMRGHGDVIVAPSLPLVVFRAVYTDVNARMQLQAIAVGGPITFLDPEEAASANKLMDQVHIRAWELWKRKLAGK